MRRDDRRARRRWSSRCRRPVAGSRAARTGRSTGRGPRRGRSTAAVVPSTSSGGSSAGELQRRLAAERHDDAAQVARSAARRSMMASTSSRGDRLEVQPVGRVVVGRHGLGVAVDHDRLEAGVAQRERGVHAAVVELDPLPDAVRARAEDDHLRPVAGAHLVLVLVGRVVVRRLGRELRRARVDRLERDAHACVEAARRARRPPARDHSHASCASPKPRRLARRQSRAGHRRRSPSSARWARSSTICAIWSRNHGSTFVAS